MLSPFRASALTLVALVTFVSARAERVEVLPVRDPARVESLDGAWKFRYEAGPASPTAPAFVAPAFNDSGWATLAVPAHWELHGFAEPKYARVDDGSGYYRRLFRIPPTWRDRRVLLHFDGVLYGLEAWVNGKRVGDWASSYNPVTFDITDAIDRGAENVIAVHVSTHPKGWEFDTNDCWALSGIFRGVSLWAVPPTYFEHYTARTRLLPDGRAQLAVEVRIAGAGTNAKVRGHLTAPDGRSVGEFTVAVHDSIGATTLAIDHPQLWTAETPLLHQLDLQLMDGDRVVQEARERIGLREVSIVDGVLLLNGRPIKLRGVDHHDIWPQEGRVASEALIRRDLEMIRAANANFIRTSHYPPHPRMVELCDELGIYLMVEVPFGFGDVHLTDPSYQDILYTRARATVLRDENHPSVIVWSVGNENPNTPLTFATGRCVKELDPTRPICFPQVGSYFARTHQDLPPWVDIYAPHYPNLATVENYAATLNRPVIFTEYAHSLGLTGEEVQREWPVMQASLHLAGGAVWMFQDQGILRRAEAITDKEAARLAVYPDPAHAYDTEADKGMDGVVYSDRVPQPDYWELRKVYSPVQIAPGVRRVNVAPGESLLPITVENRFDFRSLAGVELGWALRRNGHSVQQGRIALTSPAHDSEVIKIPANIPADAVDDVLALNLVCRDRGSAPLYERAIRLVVSGSRPAKDRTDPTDPSATRRFASPLVAELTRGPVTITEDAAAVHVRHPLGELVVDRGTGVIRWLDRAGKLLATGPYPHAGRRFTQGELMREKKEHTWPGSYLEHPQDLAVEAHPVSGGGVAVTVRGRYARPDDATQALEGSCSLQVQPTGAVEVSYDYHFVSAKGLILEAGVSFLTGPEQTELRWVGDGPYPAYPDKDVLDEPGVYDLNRDDIEFQGNRRAVDLAVLCAADGSGLALTGNAMDIAVEREESGTLFSHNALISGRGQKGGSPETMVMAETSPALRGELTVLPLTSAWPVHLQRWLGSPTQTVKPFRPYYRSYDQ